jgi:Fur family ferric uptake transcriptional regulator
VSEDPVDLLREHGLQVTAQRAAVLRAVTRIPHATADEVMQAVRDDLGAISRQAVYDALGAVTDRGIVRRIQPAGSPARYERRVGDNHHHLICRSCNRVLDVDCAVGAVPCLTPADDGGFEVDEAEVIYWGRCPDCRRHGAVAPTSGARSPSAAATATSDTTARSDRSGATDRSGTTGTDRTAHTTRSTR